MEWWQTLLMTAGTCFITLLITFIFNWVVNRPQKRKEEQAQAKIERTKELEQVKEDLQKSIQEVKSERIRERDLCQKDHTALVALVKNIIATNTAQNQGLQAVLKDLLKIRYLKWIDEGYAPMDARDDLEKMYQAYHNLGANGVLTELRNQFLKLPVKEVSDKNYYKQK